MTSAEKLLQRPLYVFDVPNEILDTLQSKTDVSVDTASPAAKIPQNSSSHEEESKPATSCTLCGLSFAGFQEQRKHVRSDLHGYNTKQKSRGQPVVSEIEFERLLEQLEESISGSDTTASGEEDEVEDGDKLKSNTLSSLLKRQAKLHDGDADDAPGELAKPNAGKPPLVWFHSSDLPSNISLGVYRAIFTSTEQSQGSDLVRILKNKQLRRTAAAPLSIAHDATDESDGGVPLPKSTHSKPIPASGPSYFLCMVGGGHFAAMLVSLTPKITKKGGLEDRSASVIAHKTFHRYTTRRKQGGSQSANDNAKGNAHSAGSSLRRYNEVALEKDIRDLLAEWRAGIDAAELLFVRATGVTNRRTLYGPYDGQVLHSRDTRIRGFPFSTKRATQSELMRAFVELTRIKISSVDEEALAKQAEAAAQAAATAKAASLAASVSSPKLTKPSKAEEEALLHTTQIQALIKRSKAPALVSYIQTNSISPDSFFSPQEPNYQAPTPLHLAAHLNSAACVTSLLLKLDADPTIRNHDGKAPFELAGDRVTRDAFRLARSQLGEQKWDWDAAGVPAALLREEVDARNARDREEKRVEEAAEKQRRAAEVARLRREDAEQQANRRDGKFGKGHSLLDVKMTAEERRAEQARGMSDEMRMRVEREKRARAAEERIRRMQNK